METVQKCKINQIIMTRGDTMSYKFRRKNKDGQPILEIAPKIYFSIKDTDLKQEVVIQKTIEDMTFEDGWYSFTIYPEDTNNLTYGDYTYDIEVRNEYDNYTRTLSKGIYTLEEETTWAENEV